MRITLQCLLLAFVVCYYHANAEEPDPSKSGSHSLMFSYVLEFSPASNDAAAHFKATLTNITNNDLEVQVNDKAFHSTLEITSKSEKKIEAFNKRYRDLLLTSTWFEPFITIQSKKSITWTVPLTSLLTLHGDEVTHDLLADRQVVSEMVIMVVPKSGSSVSDNATQRSKPITIPTQEDNKSEMATPRKPSD